MIERSWTRFLDSLSDNRKSKIKNRKLAGILAVVATFAMCGVVAVAQQPTKIPRIGYLALDDTTFDASRAQAIRLALRELGYMEGQNIAFEYRYAEGKRHRYPDLSAELVVK